MIDFSKVSLSGAVAAIKSAVPRNKFVQECSVPESAGASVEILLGIQYTDKVFIHFLIFRVSNMSYNNIKIDSTSKIAESEGHEHVILSFFVQGSEHSLLTQQEIEGLVYQI